MKKWTKREIKSCCDAISGFWVHHRDSAARTHATAELARVIDADRAGIVERGLEGLRRLGEGRAVASDKTADHYRDHPELYGPPDKTHWSSEDRRRLTRDELVANTVSRFRLLAAEDRKGAAWIAALVERVRVEGLPPEVVAFDPAARPR